MTILTSMHEADGFARDQKFKNNFDFFNILSGF